MTSAADTSNMDSITARVWLGWGLKAMNAVQRREVSVQFMGVE